MTLRLILKEFLTLLLAMLVTLMDGHLVALVFFVFVICSLFYNWKGNIALERHSTVKAIRPRMEELAAHSRFEDLLLCEKISELSCARTLVKKMFRDFLNFELNCSENNLERYFHSCLSIHLFQRWPKFEYILVTGELTWWWSIPAFCLIIVAPPTQFWIGSKRKIYTYSKYVLYCQILTEIIQFHV